MNILLIEYRDLGHPEAGGAEVILFEIYGRLARMGHRVDYLCTRYRGVERSGVMDDLNVIRRGYQPFFNFVVPWVYRSELAANQYDVIVEGIDKIPFFMSFFQKRLPVMCTVPHLFGTTVFDQASFLAGAYVWLYERLIPTAYRTCHFSALSESTCADLVGRGVGSGRIHVIHPGLDHETYVAPAKNERNARPTVLYLGRIKKYKGIDIVMRAVARVRERYPDVDYQVVGQGDYVDALRRLAVDLGVKDNVSFLGLKTGPEKISLIQKADVIAYASPKEGWGMSVIEANACGTLVVASNSPGLRDSVRDGQTGFLVPHGDIDALADRVDRLLSDQELYGQMRGKAIEWAQTFTWERSTQMTLELLERAVEEKRAGT